MPTQFREERVAVTVAGCPKIEAFGEDCRCMDLATLLFNRMLTAFSRLTNSDLVTRLVEICHCGRMNLSILFHVLSKTVVAATRSSLIEVELLIVLARSTCRLIKVPQ